MLQKTWYSLERKAVARYARWMLQLDIFRMSPLPDGPKIFCANHPSTTDPVFLSLVTDVQIHILITEMCFKVPLIGRSLRLAGHVPVETNNGLAAFQEAVSLLEDGQSVGVFPEGALSPLGGGMGRLRSGAARMALLTGAPVIPVGIYLQKEGLRIAETRVGDMKDTARWYLRGPYAITVGEPLYFAGDMQDRELAHAVTGRIQKRILQLSDESARRMQARRSILPGAPYPVDLAFASEKVWQK